jgi:hypothetical protein
VDTGSLESSNLEIGSQSSKSHKGCHQNSHWHGQGDHPSDLIEKDLENNGGRQVLADNHIDQMGYEIYNQNKGDDNEGKEEGPDMFAEDIPGEFVSEIEKSQEFDDRRGTLQFGIWADNFHDTRI